MDCPNHKIVPEGGWKAKLSDDEVKVICQQAGRKEITFACSRWATREECESPLWCPKKVTRKNVREKVAC